MLTRGCSVCWLLIACCVLAVQVINSCLDELIDKCKRLVEEEDAEFEEEFLSEQDPSILHFLLASGLSTDCVSTLGAAAASLHP